VPERVGLAAIPVTGDPVATLTALAAELRFRGVQGDTEQAEHIDGVIARYEQPGCDVAKIDVRELLAVAEALGITA
jgi:hypothetical protein